MEQLNSMGGYPQNLRRLAVACGRGDGRRSLPPDQLALSWTKSPFAEAELKTLPEEPGAERTIAKGHCLLANPAVPDSLAMASDYSWEGAPGGSNVYNLAAGAMAGAIGYGKVTTPVAATCSVPTVSALDIDGSPFDPVPPPGSGASPFHDYIYCKENEHHLTITPRAGDWLLRSLGQPVARP